MGYGVERPLARQERSHALRLQASDLTTSLPTASVPFVPQRNRTTIHIDIDGRTSAPAVQDLYRMRDWTPTVASN